MFFCPIIIGNVDHRTHTNTLLEKTAFWIRTPVMDHQNWFPPALIFDPQELISLQIWTLSETHGPPRTYFIEVWTPRPLWNMNPFMTADTHWFTFMDQLTHGLVSYPGFWWGVPAQQEPGYKTSPWLNKFFGVSPMKNMYPLSFLHNFSILHITHLSLCTRHFPLSMLQAQYEGN